MLLPALLPIACLHGPCFSLFFPAPSLCGMGLKTVTLLVILDLLKPSSEPTTTQPTSRLAAALVAHMHSRRIACCAWWQDDVSNLKRVGTAVLAKAPVEAGKPDPDQWLRVPHPYSSYCQSMPHILARTLPLLKPLSQAHPAMHSLIVPQP